jgi:hypothetical protein
VRQPIRAERAGWPEVSGAGSRSDSYKSLLRELIAHEAIKIEFAENSLLVR